MVKFPNYGNDFGLFSTNSKSNEAADFKIFSITIYPFRDDYRTLKVLNIPTLNPYK